MWLGLGTLGQIPQNVGETDEGDLVFVASGARLVLRPTSRHFRRLDPCAKCGTETVGSAVVTRRDLRVPGQPVFCKGCVAAASGDRGDGVQGDDRFDFDEGAGSG